MTNIEAVERAIGASGLEGRDEMAPLLMLLRVLARQMDAAGEDPSTRLSATYLSALKDLTRAIASAPKGQPSSRLTQLRAGAQVARGGGRRA